MVREGQVMVGGGGAGRGDNTLTFIAATVHQNLYLRTKEIIVSSELKTCGIPF